MKEHAKGHGNGPAAQHAEPAKAAPGRTTQHERGEPGAKRRAAGSVFDAFRAPPTSLLDAQDGAGDHDNNYDHEKHGKHGKHEHDAKTSAASKRASAS